jgi:threonine/homoserine/homoserine lactone efflux protein
MMRRMLRAFLAGGVAGYGIAIPVGAIAVLIVDTGLRRGLLPAMAAGLGAATADLLYAVLAMAGGVAIASLLAPISGWLRLVSAAILLAIAAVMLIRALRSRRRERRAPDPEAGRPRGLRRTFGGFLALTLSNPLTIIYFTALILGLRDQALTGLEAKAAFVGGVFVASLSWQWLLAGAGTALRHRLSDTARTVTSLVGAAIVAGLALRIGLQL